MTYRTLSGISEQGWGLRGLSSTSRTARGQKLVALTLALKKSGLDLGLDALVACNECAVWNEFLVFV